VLVTQGLMMEQGCHLIKDHRRRSTISYLNKIEKSSRFSGTVTRQ